MKNEVMQAQRAIVRVQFIDLAWNERLSSTEEQSQKRNLAGGKENDEESPRDCRDTQTVDKIKSKAR